MGQSLLSAGRSARLSVDPPLLHRHKLTTPLPADAAMRAARSAANGAPAWRKERCLPARAAGAMT